jgi:tRNA nucleotidyltransferase/poly(A) polymerase
VVLGQPLAGVDVDLTTPCLPDELEKRLHKAGFVVDTKGKAFGSLAVTILGQQVEITSFRADTYDKGRRFPKVRFGVDMQTDAQRRDFTLNAFYVGPDGTVEDPLGGVPDAKAGLVRFVGNPAVRLAEDPLRAVRFLRFCALYGTAGMVPPVMRDLEACAPAIAALNPARVAREKLKGQGAPYLADVAAVLDEYPVLKAYIV